MVQALQVRPTTTMTTRIVVEGGMGKCLYIYLHIFKLDEELRHSLGP